MMGSTLLRLCLLWLALVAAAIPLAFMACTSATVPEVDAPPSTEPSASLLESVPRITIDELLQEMADNNSNILIVDTRHAEQYEVDHIKGAVSVPLDTITSGGWMPPLDKEVIFYCG